MFQKVGKMISTNVRRANAKQQKIIKQKELVAAINLYRKYLKT